MTDPAERLPTDYRATVLRRLSDLFATDPVALLALLRMSGSSDIFNGRDCDVVSRDVVQALRFAAWLLEDPARGDHVGVAGMQVQALTRALLRDAPPTDRPVYWLDVEFPPSGATGPGPEPPGGQPETP